MVIVVLIIAFLCVIALAKILLSDRLVNKRMYIRATNRDDIDSFKADSSLNVNTTKILFIGNSYTYFNDMPNIIKRLAESAGKEVVIGSFTKGGYSLSDHINSNDEHSNRLKQLLTYNWDVIILQDQSLTPVVDVDKFYEGVEAIVSLVDRDVTRVLMYSTWARKTDELSIDDTGMSKEDLRVALSNSYIKLASQIDAEICPVGDAFSVAEEGEKNINLYWFDGSHPWYKGSYLSACVIYSVIFNESCEGLDYYGNIFSQDKKLLQQYAKAAVYGEI